MNENAREMCVDVDCNRTVPALLASPGHSHLPCVPLQLEESATDALFRSWQSRQDNSVKQFTGWFSGEERRAKPRAFTGYCPAEKDPTEDDYRR